MLSLLMQSVSNASFGIYFPRFTGTIFEHLSAPVSLLRADGRGIVGAAATKSIILGDHHPADLGKAVRAAPRHRASGLDAGSSSCLTAVTFSLFGFLIGIWATGFESLQLIPLLIITPLTFLGGSFYSIDMLPPFWRNVSLLNPVFYLVSGFRWSFFDRSEVSVGVSLAMTLVFLAACVAIVAWMFRTGYRLKP